MLPTELCVQWVCGGLSLGVKRLGHEVPSHMHMVSDL